MSSNRKVSRYVIGNWKLHGLMADIRPLAIHLRNWLQKYKEDHGQPKSKVVICPSFPYLGVLQPLIGNSLSLGAQDCSVEAKGAFTGDVSAAMLQDVGCNYVIVGHSERRGGRAETNDMIKRKATHAQETDLTPIVCIGETRDAYEKGQTQVVLKEQLESSLPPDPYPLIIAYEPIWAIGTGLTPTPDEITKTHQFIHDFLAQRWPGDGGNIAILYGGSVNADNCHSILAQPYVDGVLVGGASLKGDEFAKIITASEEKSLESTTP